MTDPAIGPLAAAARTYRRASSHLERHARFVVLAIVLWVMVVLLVLARAKPYWHDEIYTLLIAQLPIATIWRASVDGIDLSPPLTAMATHTVYAAAGVGPITTRLPAILSFIGGLLLIFAVVRRRSTIGFAIVAVLLATLTGAWGQAYEARGQGLAFGLFALALYGWLEAAAGRHVRRNLIVMALALGVGVWAHYYFVLAYLPIVAGEATRQIARRRFDLGSWLAVLASGLVVLPLLFPLGTAALQRETFWARPGSFEIAPIYYAVLDRLWLANSRIAAGALILIGIATLARRFMSRRWPSAPPAHEVVSGAICLALPALGLLLAEVAGVFHERYVLFSAAGLSMTTPILFWWLTTPSVLAEVIAAVAVLHGFGNLTEHAFKDTPTARMRLEDCPVVMNVANQPGPLVVNGGPLFLELWHSAPPALRTKLVYLADADSERSETGADTVDLGYLALARWTTMPAVSLEEFLRTNDRFTFYSVAPDWVLASLAKAPGTLAELGRDEHGTLYEYRRQ